MYDSSTGFINADSNTAFAALFGEPTIGAQEYISQRVGQYAANFGNHIPELVNTVVEKYNYFKNNVVSQKIDLIKASFNNVWQTDTIKYLNTVAEIRVAQPVMRRWVMAQPDLRERYNRGALNGYGDGYIDGHPGGAGTSHYDYRLVYNGVTVLENDVAITRTFFEQIRDDELLSIVEKLSIIKTHKVIERHIASGSNIDPTSRWHDTM